MVTLVNHPLVLYRLTLMRDKRTGSAQFRNLLSDLSYLMAYEVLKDLATTEVEIETPLTTCKQPSIRDRVTLVSVLRAGDGMLDGFLKAVPFASVGHLGVSRDHETLQPREYLASLPAQIEGSHVVILDPMLATGGSLMHAIQRVTPLKPASIRCATLLAAPEGLQAVTNAFPNVEIYTAAIDSHLNEKGYIVPGLGDAGDRLFKT